MRLLRDVDRQIFRVAVPAFFALITEPLMLLADTSIIGHLGTPELGGLAAASVVLGTAVGLCIFLAYGSTATVSRHHGAGDERTALSLAVSSLWLAAGLGVVLAVVTAIASGALTDALSSSSAVAGFAQDYLLVSALALPAMLLILAATGAMRGVLDLRTPLIATIVANILNVVLNLTFVYGFDWGVRGAAAGTVIAQWFAAAWLVTVVVRRARRVRASTRPRTAEIVGAARLGVPLLVRTITLRASLVLATLVAAQLGDVPLAANQVAAAVVTFLAFGLDAIAIAGQTLTGRTLGAGDADGTRALTNRMVGLGRRDRRRGCRRAGGGRALVAATLQLRPGRAGRARAGPARRRRDPAALRHRLRARRRADRRRRRCLSGQGRRAGPRGVRAVGPGRRVDRRRLHLAVGRVRRVHRGPTRDAVAAPAGDRVDGARRDPFGRLRS